MTRDKLFETTFVFGKIVLEELKMWKDEKFGHMDQCMRNEAESAFKSKIDLARVEGMTFKLDEITLLSAKQKGGKADGSDGRKASLEVRVDGREVSLTVCSEKSNYSLLGNLFGSIFKVKTSNDPKDVVYYKFTNEYEIHDKCVKKGVVILWKRHVATGGSGFFIVAVGSNGSSKKVPKSGLNKMDEKEVIIMALTGLDRVYSRNLDLLTSTSAVDYGDVCDETFNFKCGRCAHFFDCEDTSPRHTARYTHACKYGAGCRTLDGQHRKMYLHAKVSCNRGDGCTDESAEHRMIYHGEIKRWCEHNPCNEYGNPHHMKEFIHGPRAAKYVSFDGLATESGHIPDYDENISAWMKQTAGYLGVGDMSQNENFKQISRWMSHLQSVHQCSGRALASIVKVGMIASLSKLRSMWLNPSEITHIVWLRDDGKAFLSRLSSEEELKSARKYTKMYCRVLQAERSPKILKELQDKVIMGIPIDSVKFALNIFKSASPLNQGEIDEWRKIESKAKKTLGRNIDTLNRIVESALEIVQKTLEGASGIGFDVDKKIGTDRVVFAIHGPNMGKYGDAEVAIVFRPEISRHPDAFMTPVAAMGYYQGWYVKNDRVGTDRPWAGPAKIWNDSYSSRSAKYDYERSKFHGTTQRWSDACAMEWIARVVQNSRRERAPQSVTLRDVQELWHKSDPHAAIEAHLPGLISLDLVERVYIANKARGDVGDAERVLRGLGVAVEYVNDTRDAVEMFMNAPQQQQQQTPQQQHKQADMQKRGYDFYVEEGGKEHVVPIDLEKLCSGDFDRVIRLSVVKENAETNDLMITFSDELPGSSGAHGKRNCTSFTFYPSNVHGFVSEMQPRDIVRSNPNFASPTEHFLSDIPGKIVYYTLVFSRDAIALRKSGISSVFNNTAMKIPRRNARFISFSSRTFPCYISNLAVCKRSSNDVKSLERARPTQVPPRSMFGFFNGNNFGGSEPVPASSRSQSYRESYKGKPTENPHGSEERPPPRPPKPSPPAQPWGETPGGASRPSGGYDQSNRGYRDDTFSCQTARRPEFAEDKQRMDQYNHVCRYGLSCKYMQDPQHMASFYHFKKEVCKYGDRCNKLCDAQHRAEFHHPGLWDWLDVCNKGLSCPKMSNEEHCQKYTHGGFVPPVEKKW